MNFIDYFFGEASLNFHLAGIALSILGSLVAKFHFYKLNVSEKFALNKEVDFSLGFWLKKNIEDLIVAQVVAFLFVRFSHILIEWLNPKIEAAFSFRIPDTEDQIFYYFIAGVLVQLWIHKKYKSRRQTK